MSDPVTLLLVDDEESIRRLIARTLEGEGYSVLQAGSAADALQQWESHKQHVALVITDIRMPGMTGDELVEELDVDSSRPPVLFISGYGQEGLWLPGPLLPKPFQLDALSSEVKRLLREGRKGDSEAADESGGEAAVA